MTSAAKARAYINAAFNFGLKGAHDYTLPDATTNWGLTSNPVLAIKTDASARRFGQRFLSPGEFKILWDWCKENNGYSMFTRTVQLLMATGQRVEEILRITNKTFDPESQMLFWDKTKNKLPHSIPITSLASDILIGMTPDKHGFYFPHRINAGQPAAYDGVGEVVDAFIWDTKVDHFTPRVLRRTFKTLAGDAGISKECATGSRTTL